MNLDELVNKIKADAEKIIHNCEPLGIENEKIFIVEGDIGLTELEVVSYAQKRLDLAKGLAEGTREEKKGLLGIEEEQGKLLRWQRGKILHYAIWKRTFTSETEYQTVVDSMIRATADWESICGVKFKHNASLDNSEALRETDVDFRVLRQDSAGSTVARAFFPNDELKKRIVWVYNGFFDSDGFAPEGVMRHELGHVLGFRHEHIRPEAPDLFKPESLEHTQAINDYDPMSVMHYVAKNVGNPALTFTDNDRRGARQVYGGPDTEFTFAK